MPWLRRKHPALVGPHQFVKQFVLAALHLQNQILVARAEAFPGLLTAGIFEVILSSDVLLVAPTPFPRGWFSVFRIFFQPVAWMRNCFQPCKITMIRCRI